MKVKNFIVVKKLANDFWVKYDNQIALCKPRGNLKSKGIFVGDYVNLVNIDNQFVIENVLPRNNVLIRPPLANLEQLLIVISPIPKPDFMIIDKLILFAYSYGIEPILVINKQDISTELNEYIDNTYSNFIKTVFVSAKTESGIDSLKDVLKNKLSAFAGQSAVGKSALVNSLFKNLKTKEGELSQKIQRGKNTTRHCEIFFSEDIMLCDTAGFTSLDEKLLPIAYFELPYYYKDYNVYKTQCRYTNCTHTNEPINDCKIKQLVASGNLDKERYERYKKMYKILEEKWVREHG